MNPVAHWQDRFAGTAERGPGSLAALRRKAIDRFAETGFPTTRIEEWRYTNPAAIAKLGWQPATPVEVEREAFERVAFPVFACSVVVFVNGHYVEALSTPPGLRPRLGVTPLAGEFVDADGARTERLGSLAGAAEGGFADLNTAFFRDGAHVRIPQGEIHEEPIHLVFVNAPGAGATDSHPRVLIEAEPGSRATVIEDHVSLARTSAGETLTNAITEIHADDGARVEWIKVQREHPGAFHVSGMHARVGRDARLSCHTLAFGTALTRNDLRVTLAEPGAECDLSGLFVAGGEQHVDNHTWIDHAKPHGTSRELYKGILDGRARGVFNGRVVVRPDAQKSNAQQQNPNLLLSRDAEMSTQPQLEIRADDVRCTHGSTIGQLDETALFYLRSRGIPRDEARQLLMRGFVSEITRGLSVPALAERIEDLAVERLETGREPADGSGA
ncbi:MAG: Fe-S cluster assembly protein SufD [Myxococcales bacterium]|nr:Fe-S cluster assembly protein SufD [Myxococcales bacterium]